jgi:acetyl esterase
VPIDVPRAAIVYLHGGGWVLGSIAEFDTLGRILAARTECAVVLVEYRLAPEHPYPAAVEDAWAALRWTDDHLEEIAGRQVPVLVAGDSSGGNLAAVLAQRAAATGQPVLAGQELVYPVTDADLDTASYTDPANQLMVSRESMTWFWNHYVPDPGRRTEPGVAPLRAPEFAGLPPAVVITAEHDVTRDEGEAYVERLRAAGVPVEHQRFAGQLHGFFTMVSVLPGSAAGIDFVVGHIRRLLDAPALPNTKR